MATAITAKDVHVLYQAAVTRQMSTTSSDVKLTKNRQKKIRQKMKRKNAAALKIADMMTPSVGTARLTAASGDIIHSSSKTKQVREKITSEAS
jgi:hypothetical protein